MNTKQDNTYPLTEEEIKEILYTWYVLEAVEISKVWR